MDSASEIIFAGRRLSIDELLFVGCLSLSVSCEANDGEIASERNRKNAYMNHDFTLREVQVQGISS